ncbi:MAG: type 4a pilus biogenesis protein PilO [Actinobacteria bacterium]|nr:type 4a pilus biogenesis protein PilO [Actinomycetota bacterium]
MSRRGPILVGAIVGALALVVAALLVLPKMSQVGERREELTVEEDREQSLRTQLAQLEDLRDQARAVQKELNRLQNQIPPTAELPSLIRLLENTANQSAVSFISVTPGTPSAAGTEPFSLIPTQITVTGGFFSIDEFLFRLETLPRALKVIQIAVATSAEGAGELQLSMTTEVYTTDISAGPGSQPGPTEALPVETPPEEEGAGEASPPAGG